MVLSALFVGETYAPTLLRRKAKTLQKMADEQGTGEVFISKYDVNRKSRIEIIRVGMSRPLEMMAKELIIAALGTYGMACSVHSPRDDVPADKEQAQSSMGSST